MEVEKGKAVGESNDRGCKIEGMEWKTRVYGEDTK